MLIKISFENFYIFSSWWFLEFRVNRYIHILGISIQNATPLFVFCINTLYRNIFLTGCIYDIGITNKVLFQGGNYYAKVDNTHSLESIENALFQLKSGRKLRKAAEKSWDASQHLIKA